VTAAGHGDDICIKLMSRSGSHFYAVELGVGAEKHPPVYHPVTGAGSLRSPSPTGLSPSKFCFTIRLVLPVGPQLKPLLSCRGDGLGSAANSATLL
jgi:hypothetical protein